jgi:circadian clock protein KaiC
LLAPEKNRHGVGGARARGMSWPIPSFLSRGFSPLGAMMTEQDTVGEEDQPRISSGSMGLDHILGGGLDANRVYLYEGQPGTGKTTIAFQFLLEGVRLGEPVLYITLSETTRELRLMAKRHGWSLAGVTIFELVPPETTLNPEQELTVFQPAELELGETTRIIFDQVEKLTPTRVVLDSLSELRLLAQSPLRYRRQILALKHFFAERQCTVALLDDLTSSQNDLQLHSIAHGVVMLEQHAIDYGAERRRIRVIKMRGMKFRGGYHDFTIERGGLHIHPRLVAAEHHKDFVATFAASGNFEIDTMLGGGLERGTNAHLIGAAGVGKSSLALTYAIAAAGRNGTRLSSHSTKVAARWRRERGLWGCLFSLPWTPASFEFSKSIPPRCRPANSPRTSSEASRSTTRES